MYSTHYIVDLALPSNYYYSNPTKLDISVLTAKPTAMM